MVRIALALIIVSQLAVWLALESVGTPANIVVIATQASGVRVDSRDT